jgi:type I restriction enzyme S subunit
MAGRKGEKSLGECAILVHDTISPAELHDEKYVGLEHIGEGTLSLVGYGFASDVASAKSRFKRGDILFGKLRPYFHKVVRAPFDGVCSTDIWVVRPRDGIDAGFLYYCMASQAFIDWATQGSDGTKMPRAQWAYASKFNTVVPDLPEQRAIAHVLGTLDDKIELNRQMNETLEAMAQALFKSWFIDFDPVHAKAEGRDTGLPPDVAELFPDSFVDSELGPIPEGWTVRSLGELVNAVKGCSYTSEELVHSDTALVTLKSFARGGGYRSDGLKSFAGSYKPQQVVAPGEIVTACTDVTQAAAVIGRTAMVHRTTMYQTLVASLDTIIIRPTSQQITRSFLYFLGRTDEFVVHNYSHTTGTTVLHLGREAVPSFVFALPPLQLVKTFDSLAEPVLNRVQTSVEQSEMIAVLRDALLPKLLSGELRADDVGDVTAPTR